MKMRIFLVLAAMLVMSGDAIGRLPQGITSGSDKERLIGAWHLISIGEVGRDDQSTVPTEIKGTLIYTRDGHMSVQLLYPPSQSDVSNDYVLNGYEASFGRFDVDEVKHTVTHHVEGSVTRGLIGKDLPLVYRLSGNRMIIRSTRPDEHWSVTWEHY